MFGGPDKDGLTVSVRSMLPQKVRGAPATLAPLPPSLQYHVCAGGLSALSILHRL